MSSNSFDARSGLVVGDRSYEVFRLDALQASYDVARLPFSLKVLLENLLRNEDGESIRARDIEALARWDAKAEPSEEIAFTPARVLMQDFTGVPAIVGQPMSMLIPQVVGFRLTGELQEGATATDLVLTVTEMLRRHGVVGKFVEFHGAGLANLPLADRATIGNMSPEFGCTCAIFPIDAETLRYLEFSGRPSELLELVEAYAKEQGLWHDEDSEEPTFSEELELDLAAVVPSVAGPRRPQDRVALTDSKQAFRMALEGYLPDDDPEDEAVAGSFPASDPVAMHVAEGDGQRPGGVSGTGGTQP